VNKELRRQRELFFEMGGPVLVAPLFKCRGLSNPISLSLLKQMQSPSPMRTDQPLRLITLFSCIPQRQTTIVDTMNESSEQGMCVNTTGIKTTLANESNSSAIGVHYQKIIIAALPC